MDPDEEMSSNEPGLQEPTLESRGGETGVALGTGIDLAMYIAVSEVLDIVSRAAVMNGDPSRTTCKEHGVS